MAARSGMVLAIISLFIYGASIALSQQISGDEIGDPGWGFKFKPPAGWKYQQDQTGAILGHDTIAGFILVMPHTEQSFDLLRQNMLLGLEEEGTKLSLNGEVINIGDYAVAGEYSGIYEWQQARARGVGTFNPDGGGGAYIIAVTTPESYGKQLADAADQIAKNMHYFKVETSDLVTHFAGEWVNTTTNTMTGIMLSPDGSYYENYEASYGGTTQDQYGSDDMSWGAARQDQASGRWTVRGNKEKGQIIISKQDGTQTVLDYQVHVENGEVYWREYWFNGSLYGKK